MKFRMTLVLLALIMPTFVSALGLGKLELQSALNQPFKARVKLLSATADELDSLKVSLADQAAFERAGIQRTFLLTKLRFSVEESESGPDYIQIRSNESIREPFLNFLLEINWSKGRLFREYTVLLDPPTYSGSKRSKKKPKVVHPKEPVVDTKPQDDAPVVYDRSDKVDVPVSTPSVAAEPPQIEPAPAPAATIDYSGSGDYGPAVSGDTLWSIAKAARPDSSVSIQQMMLAILRTNPEAFIEGNINGLKRGAILQMPDASEMNSLDKSTALDQTKNQHALWDEYKGYAATQVSERSESVATSVETTSEQAPAEEVSQEEQATAETVTETVETPVENEAELTLISEPETGTGSDQGSTDAAASIDALNNELTLANESIEALSMENAELRDKLTETEGIIDDLKRLIVLKEDELAAMQEQIMIAAAAEEEAASEAMEVVEEETTEEVVDEEVVEDVATEEETTSEAMEVVEEETTEEVADEEVMEDVAAEEEAASEEMEVLEDEEEAASEEMEVVEEEATEGVFIDEAETSSESFDFMGLLGGFDLGGIIEQVKAHTMTIAYAIGGLVLLLLAMVFASKRRSAKATTVDLSSDDYPDFGDDEVEKTVLASELDDDEVDSESVTVIPGSEDETIIPGDESAEDLDAFDIPEIPEETAAAEPEEDPMEEVNVFLAYEHFDEAESFVRQAIEKEPDNISFHAKLLEVFYAAGNKKSYEEAAKVVHEKTGGEGQDWDMVTAMWQEMSPNRALFAEPVAGEDDDAPAESTGGGVLNIADGDDSDAGDNMDFNIGGEESAEEMLDVTAAASESDDASVELDLSGGEANELLDDTIQMEAADVQQAQAQEDGAAEDVLDVTAAIDLDDELSDADSSNDEEVLDISAAASDEDMLDISGAEESTDSDELDLSLDGGEDAALEIDEPEGLDIEPEDNSLDMDISLDDDSSSNEIEMESDAIDSEEVTMNASEDDILDVSLAPEADSNEAGASDTEGDELDISFDDSSSSDGEDLLDVSISQEPEDAGEDELDISFGDTSDSGDEIELLDSSTEADLDESAGELDISFDDSSSSDGEDLLDVSISQESEDSSDDSGELDISFGDTSDDNDLLDASADDNLDSSADELDISFGDDTAGDGELLDGSADSNLEESSDELDISFGDTSDAGEDIALDDSLNADGGGEDLLDVTSAIDFESNGEEDLLDVTTATSAGSDVNLEEDLMDDIGSEADDLMSLDESAGGSDAGGLDFDLDMGTDDDSESVEMDLDISDTASDDLDMDSTIEMSPNDVNRVTAEPESDQDLDMDSTVQMPAASMDGLEMDAEDDDDDDKTFFVPKSSDVSEQSDDEEMASQLDLAKAYIELGDTENAKTILNEIIAQGNDTYKQQAEELLGQI